MSDKVPIISNVVAAKLAEDEAEKHDYYTVKRGYKLALSSWDYNGEFCRNTFRASKPIVLSRFGFFGPSGPSPGTYFAYVEVFTTKTPTFEKEKRIGKVQIWLCNVKPGEVFYVHLNKEVLVKPNEWVHVEFMLEGLNTATLAKQWANSEVDVPGGSIEFEFLHGSNQMPEIVFRMPTDKEVANAAGYTSCGTTNSCCIL